MKITDAQRKKLEAESDARIAARKKKKKVVKKRVPVVKKVVKKKKKVVKKKVKKNMFTNRRDAIDKQSGY